MIDNTCLNKSSLYLLVKSFLAPLKTMIKIFINILFFFVDLLVNSMKLLRNHEDIRIFLLIDLILFLLHFFFLYLFLILFELFK